jgi:hypothetical protein
LAFIFFVVSLFGCKLGFLVNNRLGCGSILLGSSTLRGETTDSPFDASMVLKNSFQPNYASFQAQYDGQDLDMRVVAPLKSGCPML